MPAATTYTSSLEFLNFIDLTPLLVKLNLTEPQYMPL
jgi:hypothetical protein